jgi:protein-L-isoaspartate(D-aspartate) O-methyltransferase
MLLRHHVFAAPAPSAVRTRKRLTDRRTAGGNFVSLRRVEYDVDDDADDERRPCEEMVEGSGRDLRRHGVLFPAPSGVDLGRGEVAVVERDAVLREAMVSNVERAGWLRPGPVASAMRAVPRHRFLPGMPLDDAYADRAIAIKTSDGEVLSSISQPSMIALMLQLLAPERGDRVLEVGTGSGYHAALLAELVGSEGRVTTTDLDADLTARARAALEDLDYANVRVLTGDGASPTEGARYDRIIVTARSDDVAASWWQALPEGARLVVPLRLEGAGEYAVGFVRRGPFLESVGVHPCAFLALRGEAAGEGDGDLFYRDPEQRSGRARARPVARVHAVRRDDARPSLLEEADLVIARPATVFAVTFTS